MFNSLSSYQNSNEKNAKEAEIVSFNNQYESFARDDIRGSDIYSLLNKVVDYNRRNSTAGTGSNSGQYIGYKPLEVQVTIKKEHLKEIWYTEQLDSHLIGNNLSTDVTIIVNATTNTFGDTLFTGVNTLRNTYGENALNKLVSGITSIFIDDSSDDNEKDEAVKKYNSISTKKTANNYDDIKEGSTYRKDVYRYREYVQFKRAKFNCKDAIYDQETGRIIKMIFESNGKFE